MFAILAAAFYGWVGLGFGFMIWVEWFDPEFADSPPIFTYFIGILTVIAMLADEGVRSELNERLNPWEKQRRKARAEKRAERERTLKILREAARVKAEKDAKKQKWLDELAAHRDEVRENMIRSYRRTAS